MPYAEASRDAARARRKRKRGEIPDQLLFVEHPHVITLGRNGRYGKPAAQSEEVLRRAGIEFHETNRGGDITYHGPGQIVGYPIFDLREWKRDVIAYVRAMERCHYRCAGRIRHARRALDRAPQACGSDEAKICAIGVHISRWVTSHGFALNHTTDLKLFSIHSPLWTHQTGDIHAGSRPNGFEGDVQAALAREFSRQFDRGELPNDSHNFSRQ